MSSLATALRSMGSPESSSSNEYQMTSAAYDSVKEVLRFLASSACALEHLLVRDRRQRTSMILQQ